MVVVSFCGNVRHFDSCDINDLRVAVTRQFLLEGLTFDIICGDDNRLAQNEDIAANYDFRVKADDQALIQLEQQSHDYHNMKWALVREHLGNLRSEFVDLKKQNQLLEHRYHQVQDALEMERTTRNSMVKDLKANFIADTHAKGDIIARVEQETKNTINARFHDLQEQIRASNLDIWSLRDIHENDVMEVEQKMQTLAGEAERNFQSAQHDMAKLASKQEEHFSNLQKEDERMHFILDHLQKDTVSFQGTITNKLDRLCKDHDAFKRAANDNHTALRAAAHEEDSRVTLLEEKANQMDLLYQADMSSLRQNLQGCKDLHTILEQDLSTSIEHTSEHLLSEIKKLAVQRTKVENDMIEEFRPKIQSSEAKITTIFRWITSQTEANSLNKQYVADIERRLVNFESSAKHANQNLQGLVEELDKAHNERHDDALSSVQHIEEKLTNRLLAMESDYKKSISKSTHDLIQLFTSEQLARETTINEQRNWMGDWRNDFSQAQKSAISESERKVAEIIQELQETIDTLTKTGQERAMFFGTRLEFNYAELSKSLKMVEEDMQAKMNALFEKLSEVSSALSATSDTRFQTLTDDLRRSSTSSEDAISQLIEVDSRLDSLMHDVAKVKQHIPMLFVTI